MPTSLSSSTTGCLALVALWATSALAVDHVVLKREGKEMRVSGQLLVTAEDGGILVMAADGTLWAVQPEELVEQTHDDEPFEPLRGEKLTKQLMAELPAGFEVHTTAHYVICYNTSREYAAWCGGVFERLYRGFTNYWTRKGCKLSEPEFPLVAIIFGDRDAYVEYSKSELGKSAESIIGYYSLRSNRVTMYDLTGIQALRRPGDRRGSANEINQMLARPGAEQSVATIVHEATHQITFNSGLQTRFADIPVWLSEGLAVYFETPDLTSPKGWKSIGSVNHDRLETLRDYLPKRPAGSLKALIADDKRMRTAKVAPEAYAEAWALNYYLIRQHPKQYVAYLKMLSEKKQLFWDDPETRLKEFQAAFGSDLDRLESDFLKQTQKLR